MRNAGRLLATFVATVVIGGIAVGACLAALVPGTVEIATAHRYTVKQVKELSGLAETTTVYWGDDGPCRIDPSPSTCPKMGTLGLLDRQTVSLSRGAGAHPERGHRHRGPHVLDQRRHRPRRGVPRLPHQRRVRRDRPGWLDDHPAAREEPHRRRQARREPQGPRARGRAPPQREVLEGQDPRGVPQHRVLRSGLLRHQRRGPPLLPHRRPVHRRGPGQGDVGAHHRRGRAPRRGDLEPGGQQPVLLPRPRHPPPRRRAARHGRPGATSPRSRPTRRTTSRCPR